MKDLAQLYLCFAKIGTFLFGGGYSMLPLLTRELIDNRDWATEEELLDYFAIAQCTPGVIAVNTATFVGNKRKGILGGIVATLGVVTVPMLLILIIAAVLSSFWSLPAVQHAFAGIRIAVAALIFTSVIRLAKSNIKNRFGILMCIIGFVVIAVFGQSPIVVVLITGLCGILYGRRTQA